MAEPPEKRRHWPRRPRDQRVGQDSRCQPSAGRPRSPTSLRTLRAAAYRLRRPRRYRPPDTHLPPPESTARSRSSTPRRRRSSWESLRLSTRRSHERRRRRLPARRPTDVLPSERCTSESPTADAVRGSLRMWTRDRAQSTPDVRHAHHPRGEPRTPARHRSPVEVLGGLQDRSLRHLERSCGLLAVGAP